MGKCPFSIKGDQKSGWARAHPAYPAPTPLDKKGWVGGLKFAIIKKKMSTGVGGWSKKSKILSTWFLNDPLIGNKV